jgi:RNA polymerase sigma factor (sigma-70 family)
MGLSREEAEDVGLDALAVAYDRWARVRDLPYRQAWALKVTANLALRGVKRGRLQATFAPPLARNIEEDVTSRMAVSGALARLPRRQRQVAVLRYLADLPEAEVAQTLGIDVGTVKRHASRARMALQDTMSLGGVDDVC